MGSLIWLAAGLALGWMHAWSISRSVTMLRPDQAGTGVAVALLGSLLRVLGIAVVLMLGLRQSWVSGLLALAGFLVARTVFTALYSARLADTGPTSD